MSRYKRSNIQGGSYFFTAVAFQRQRFLCQEHVRAALRDAVRETQAIHPFEIDGWVLLPEHLHCIWTLPSGDADFSRRWAMIKRLVTKRCAASLFRKDLMTDSKRRRNESTIWQRRFWEHAIRDDGDFSKHMDYIHYNPVKHALVKSVKDWPYSTFHRMVKCGVYPENWCGSGEITLDHDFGE